MFQYIDKDTTNRLRNILLKDVLVVFGAKQDKYDRAKWHTQRGTLSVTDTKFTNWNCGAAGGGAIDLAMHLNNSDFKQALHWLLANFKDFSPSLTKTQQTFIPQPFIPPKPCSNSLPHVLQYLITERNIPPALLTPLIQSGTLYADYKANAVFLLLPLQCFSPEGSLPINLHQENLHCENSHKNSHENSYQKVLYQENSHRELPAPTLSPIGAELRGTLSSWRGLAQGSRKNLGFFAIPSFPPKHLQQIILVESAIDAISCFAIHQNSWQQNSWCISTAGARHNPLWLSSLFPLCNNVFCGFDADSTGDSIAHAMMTLLPSIKRLRPPAKDWNDALKARPP